MNQLKRTLLFFTLIIPAFAFTQVQHVEPLNWWIGMKDNNLQLMVNGTGVGETTPVINYTGVTIKKVNKADSKNYLFIDLAIATTTKPGTFNIKFNKAGKTLYTYDYTLLARNKNASQLKGFNPSDVIYLIVPDRFANGDYNNDVVAGMKEDKINRSFDGGRHGGDIRGMIDHLDYIAGMGFTALWPTPVLENDMKVYSYHGYSITNHYKVDPRYGTLDDYKELSVKAKQKGIKLIFDEVLNHIGTGYWFMSDLPFKNWINKPDSFVRSNHRRTVNQDLYASEYDKDLFTDGWFDKTMPDMNGRNPFMANYLIQNSIWWTETLSLGGIRQDTYGYSDKTFLQKWSCRIMSEYPNFSLVGEEWSTNPLITSYWQRGKKNKDGYESCLTTPMDFPLQEALINALKDPEDKGFTKGLAGLYESLANDFAYADPKNILVIGDNHDMDRIFMQLNQDVDLTKMALTFLLTVRGIPQIFYGTEILMDNTGHHKVDGLIRSDFPGGWKEDSVNAFSGKGLTATQSGVQNYLKQLLNWRKSNPVIANGKTLQFAPFNGLYVYFRYNKEKTIMVVMNKNDKDVSVDTKRFAEIIQGKTTAENIMTGEKQTLKDGITVKGKTALVLQVN
jgi:glycosidase